MEEHKSFVREDEKAAIAALERVGGKLTAEEDVIFSGTKLVIPERMNLPDAAKFIMTKIEEDESEMHFQHTFLYRPWDGARATLHALKKAFGMVASQAQMGMFGPIPPSLIDIPISVDETEQVPWGDLIIPVLPGLTFTLTGEMHKELGPLFTLHALGPRKHRFSVEGVFRLIENELSENSIYRGQAIDGQDKAEFIDTRAIDPSKVIYSDDVMAQLEANVWSLLRYSPEMRELGVSLKRAVLFEGPYGTGKTLSAFLTAKEAVANGWTFIYCRPGRDELDRVMATARLYQPAVVFVEDVDTIAAGDEGDGDHVARLLDLFDGIQAKDTEILVILTTNHAEMIHKGMVRPGRLDAVIHIGALDVHGIEKLTRAVIDPNLLDGHIDWEQVALAMDGFLPAFVKEAVERSLRYSLSRNKGKPSKITTDDLVEAGLGLRPQLELMEAADETGRPDALSAALRREVEKGTVDVVNRSGMRKNGERQVLTDPDFLFVVQEDK